MMHFVTFHINCAEWSCRAEVLAGAATDALVFIHGRYFHRAVRAFVIHHLDGSRWAVARTVAATDAIGQNHAILFNSHGMTGMDGSLFLFRKGLDGSSRTDLTAPRTFGTAIASFKRHYRLHEML